MYLLWTLLNFAIIIFFIVLCFRATKLLREKLGILAAIIFVVGLLSFVTNKKESKGNIESPIKSRQVADFVFEEVRKIDSTTASYVTHTIESNTVSFLNMNVMFGREQNTNKTVPVEAGFKITGLLGGHKWAPKEVYILPSSRPGEFAYTVKGSLEWLLLGIPVFSQAKTFEGVISAK